jgi:hypothetical protein
MTITLYKADSNCTEYGFKIVGTNEEDTPLHLEQLCVVRDILTKHVEDAERALLYKILLDSRKSRSAQKEYLAKIPGNDTLH